MQFRQAAPVQPPFVVHVGRLRRAPGERRAEVRRAPIPGLSVNGNGVPAGADVTVDVVLESVPGAIVVSGWITAPWVGACRRCLAETAGEVAVAVRELFDEHNDPDETYPLAGDQLDLEPLARDAVLLELPLAPLCDEACRGLCPCCGADRNGGDCDCTPVVADPRWAALDVLRDNCN